MLLQVPVGRDGHSGRHLQSVAGCYAGRVDRRRTVIVTGASSGLGLAIARYLIRRTDYRLVLTARASSLSRFAEANIQESERVLLRALDVTDAAQREAVVYEVEALGGVDVLINNAGVSYRSVVEHVTEEDRLAQMDINHRSPVELIRLVLPGMRSRRWGRILNVSSVGGMMAMPTMAVYSASKFALEGTSEALYYEVLPWNIRVSLIQPGFINSDGFEKVRMTRLGTAAQQTAFSPYREHYLHMSTFIGRVMKRVPATPESVARTVLRTIQAKNPPLRVPATFDAVTFSWIRRWLPARLYHWVLYRSLPHIKTWGQPGQSATLPANPPAPPNE